MGRVKRGFWGRAQTVAWLSATLVSGASADNVEDWVLQGDRLYSERGVANNGRGRADPERIGSAIAAYEEAVAVDPANLEARWKAMAALYFAGDFAAASEEIAHDFYERGRILGEQGIARLHERLGLRRRLSEMPVEAALAAVPAEWVKDVGRLYFWAAISEGAWARDEGLLSVVTQGVATRLGDYARLSRRLYPGIYRGGNQRLLAHLHGNLPRVPFISGWVDRKKAWVFAEEAMAIQSDDIGNQTIWGLVLLDRDPKRRDEALAMLEQVIAAEPRSDLVVEDQATQEMARERLEHERNR